MCHVDGRKGLEKVEELCSVEEKQSGRASRLTQHLSRAGIYSRTKAVLLRLNLRA